MKLTSGLLKKIIMEEVAKFGDMESTEDRAKDADEVDADEFGSDKSLEKKIDYMKALKIEESRLRRRLEKVVETRRRVARSL
jgi:hypothetical protein